MRPTYSLDWVTGLRTAATTPTAGGFGGGCWPAAADVITAATRPARAGQMLRMEPLFTPSPNDITVRYSFNIPILRFWTRGWSVAQRNGPSLQPRLESRRTTDPRRGSKTAAASH